MNEIHIILHKGMPVKNLMFLSHDLAVDYLKTKFNDRHFDQPNNNTLICSKYGSKFVIQKLNHENIQKEIPKKQIQR